MAVHFPDYPIHKLEQMQPKKSAPIPDLTVPQVEDEVQSPTDELEEPKDMMRPPLSEGSTNLEITATPNGEPLTKSALNKQEKGSDSDLEEPEIQGPGNNLLNSKNDDTMQEFGDNEIDVLVSFTAPTEEP
eukprot:TRINITY_DN13064_c0_g1_i11.p8 TRINITY_DN13064_c0_g1~~TRINITY_DN13064_c0_g1_i11.p8  ORF type:complete len:131 (+),score=21.59 TRINITY_DN13064_c0_g1_i11:643-1035(+)